MKISRGRQLVPVYWYGYETASLANDIPLNLRKYQVEAWQIYGGKTKVADLKSGVVYGLVVIVAIKPRF